jgi:hypothetical protein
MEKGLEGLNQAYRFTLMYLEGSVADSGIGDSDLDKDDDEDEDEDEYTLPPSSAIFEDPAAYPYSHIYPDQHEGVSGIDSVLGPGRNAQEGAIVFPCHSDCPATAPSARKIVQPTTKTQHFPTRKTTPTRQVERTTASASSPVSSQIAHHTGEVDRNSTVCSTDTLDELSYDETFTSLENSTSSEGSDNTRQSLRSDSQDPDELDTITVQKKLVHTTTRVF